MIQVRITHLDRENNETVMEVETFADAKKYTDRKIQKWVEQKTLEYDDKYKLNEHYAEGDDQDLYYEFQYYRLDERPYHLREWFNVMNESVLESLMNL